MHYNIQVLSESVSTALIKAGSAKVLETARFVGLMDKFFDILNVSNFINGTRKRKRFQHPFRRADDFRLAVSVHNSQLYSYFIA